MAVSIKDRDVVVRCLAKELHDDTDLCHGEARHLAEKLYDRVIDMLKEAQSDTR